MPGEGFNIAANPAAKNVAPQTTQERLDAVAAESRALEKSQRMHELGFANEGDYDQWALLEDLRKATLDLRRQSERSTAPKRDLREFAIAS